MNPITRFVGLHGGAGTTTAAATYAAATGARIAGHDTVAIADTIGLPEHNPTVFGDQGRVIDFGQIGDAKALEAATKYRPGTNIGVLRGPSYIGARRLATHAHLFDQVIVIAEPGRALGRSDIEALIDCDLLWIDANPDIARAVDAGLISTGRTRSLVRDLLDTQAATR